MDNVRSKSNGSWISSIATSQAKLKLLLLAVGNSTFRHTLLSQTIVYDGCTQHGWEKMKPPTSDGYIYS